MQELDKFLDNTYKMIDKGEFKEAFKTLEIIINNSKDNELISNSYYTLGILVESFAPDLVENENEFSLQCFEKSIEFNPNNFFSLRKICFEYGEDFFRHQNHILFLKAYNLLVNQEQKLNYQEEQKLMEKLYIYKKRSSPRIL